MKIERIIGKRIDSKRLFTYFNLSFNIIILLTTIQSVESVIY